MYSIMLNKLEKIASHQTIVEILAFFNLFFHLTHLPAAKK